MCTAHHEEEQHEGVYQDGRGHENPFLSVCSAAEFVILVMAA
jgi:hypothetical protein